MPGAPQALAGGLVGVIALGVYFGAAPPLPPPDAGATQVADIGIRYHGILLLGAWLQATGTLLCVVFFVTLVHLAGGAARLSGLLTVVGASTLLAVSVIEGAFTSDWAQAAVNGHPAVALSSYDVMTAFVHLFPVAPAPLVYLSLGAVLLGSDVLPRAFGQLALVIGAAFAVVGLVGLFAAPVLALVVVGSQSLWISGAAGLTPSRPPAQPARLPAALDLGSRRRLLPWRSHTMQARRPRTPRGLQPLLVVQRLLEAEGRLAQREPP